MPIQISCPTCQRQLRVPDNLVGQMVKCPSCQNTFVAAVDESPPPPEESPRESSSAYREDEPARESRRPRDDRDRDDEETRPSRRRARDDDDDLGGQDRPRRRRDYVPHRGSLILVLGILSLVGTGLITGIPAWIMGNSDLKQMRAGTMDPEGESNTNIGRILGMVSTILGVIGCGCFCVWMIFAVGVAGAK